MPSLTAALQPLRVLLPLILVSACSDYTWTVNERVVYEPPALLGDIQVDDPALHNCLLQAVIDQQVHEARQLETLTCSNAGIRSLRGIEQFPGLQRVNLDSNQIEDVSALALLPRLQVLQLRDNSLPGIAPLICAPRLSELALAGNAALDCKDLEYLRACDIRALDMPVHCDEQ